MQKRFCKGYYGKVRISFALEFRPVKNTEYLRKNVLIPPDFPVLLKNEAHIWHLGLALDFDSMRGFEKILCEEELARARRLRTSELYCKFVSVRAMLRHILGQYLGVLPNEIVFKYNNNGKPSIDSPINFNVSHSQNLAVFAVSNDLPIGIDVEYKRPIENLESISKRFFSSLECDQIFAAPPCDQLAVFYEIWVKKEAYVKAKGDQLFKVLDRLKKLDSVSNYNDHYFYLFEVNQSYIGALAAAQELKIKVVNISDKVFQLIDFL